MITEKVIKFKDFENEIYRGCLKLGCSMIKTALEKYDKELMASRDKTIYRNKGLRKSVIKTILGEVEYYRTIYKFINEDGKACFVYLLDMAMEMKGSGFISELLSEKIVTESLESSYRNTAREISELTGQSISHTAAWRVVQNTGEIVDKQEAQKLELARKFQGRGDLVTKVLFEEQDGVYINLQGKSRKEYGKSREIKVAIAYDGATKIGKNRYELTNKVACANFENSQKFQKRKEGIIADTYDTDEINFRFLNGDGAGWIKPSIRDDTVHFQLDPFHKFKAIRTFVQDPEQARQMVALLNQNNIELLLDYVEALSNSVPETGERENLLSLLSYFKTNKNGLVPYHQRGLDIPEPPEGKDYRKMGAMESNIFSIIGNRMKGRRACWSITGGNNMARLLCLKATKKLHDTLSNLTSVILSEKYSEKIYTKFSSADIPISLGKGYSGFKQFMVPSSMKIFKHLATLTHLSKIKI